MEVRVKAEFREFRPSQERFSGQECKVKTEPAIPSATFADDPHQPNFGMVNCMPQQLPKCRCRIDLSSPDTLERDFYAWLKGSEPASGTVPCLFASTSAFHSDYGTEQKTQVASSFLALDPLADVKNQRNRWDVLNSDSSASSDCLSSHSSVSPAHCPSANSSISSSSCSSSSSASSSSASSIGPFAPCSVVPSFPLHQHHSPHPPPLHPFFHQHHQQYRLMVTPSSCVDYFQQQKHSLKMPSSSSPSQNATAKIGQISGPRMRRKRNVDKASGRGTNLYGRSYCPGRPLSMEERAQIIHLFHGGMKVNAISKQLCISHGCVSKIITRFRETGNLMPSSHSECRRRKRQQQQQKNQLTSGTDIVG